VQHVFNKRAQRKPIRKYLTKDFVKKIFGEVGDAEASNDEIFIGDDELD